MISFTVLSLLNKISFLEIYISFMIYIYGETIELQYYLICKFLNTISQGTILKCINLMKIATTLYKIIGKLVA